MADNSKIEWCDATLNYANGCTRVSPGCGQGGQGGCYAERLAGTRLRNHPSRIGLTKQTPAGPRWTGEVRLHEPALLQALKWRRPRRIFWNAHGDLFHENVPDEAIDRLFAVAALTPQHQHLILTKRSARMRDYLNDRSTQRCDGRGAALIWAWDQARTPMAERVMEQPWPLPNVWNGVSVEDQARADERIPDLLATPAAVRFISAEPMLGPVDLDEAWHGEDALDSHCWGDCAWCSLGHPPLWNCSKGHQSDAEAEKGRSGLDWVIVGGESGPGARPMHPDWARSLRDECKAAGVPFFFKQWGEWAPHTPRAGGDLGGDVRAGKVRSIHPSGRSDEQVSVESGGRSTEPGTRYVARVGKKRAGRLLDGVLHDAFPTQQERSR